MSSLLPMNGIPMSYSTRVSALLEAVKKRYQFSPPDCVRACFSTSLPVFGAVAHFKKYASLFVG